MGEFLEHMAYGKVFLYFSLGIIIVTTLIHFLLRVFPWAKYLPALIMIFVGIYGIYSLTQLDDVFTGTANLMLFAIGIGNGLIGIFTAMILATLSKKPKKKKRRRVAEKEA